MSMHTSEAAGAPPQAAAAQATAALADVALADVALTDVALTDVALRGAGQALADTRQYVTFYIDDGIFAVPLAEVQEIIRMPTVVQVPRSPPSLEGLANLRGTVMSITSLRRIFRYPHLAHDDATRVVVINQGIPVGLVVDRMSAVVTADPDQLETVASIEATVDTDLLRGMIKAEDGRGMIMILDPARLVASEFGTERAAARAGGGDVEVAVVAAASDTTDELQLVSFVVAEQEYALTIESVQEIVQMPERINRVPRSEPHVLGVVTLRNRLLPLVSLREMFGLAPAPLDDRNKIVVVPLPDQTSVGIVMDMVREVLRVNRSLMDPVPSLLRGGGSHNEIQGICRLAGGGRLVSVLSADALFEHAAVRHAASVSAEDVENGESLMAQESSGEVGTLEDEEQFVVFRLANEEYGAPIGAVQEIVRVPEELTRLPKAPVFIRGVVNLRGSVLPVVDQRTRFDLADIERNDRQRIMVFMIDGVRTGFIVDSVSEVLKIARSAIGPTPALSAEQARLISRVANLEKQQRMILLIDVEHLLAPHEITAAATVH
jgi:purine-binding chemotaxis protein CheW